MRLSRIRSRLLPVVLPALLAIAALAASPPIGRADDSCTVPIGTREIVIDALTGRADGLRSWYRGNESIRIRLVHADFRAQNFTITVDNREGVSRFYSIVGATGGGVNALDGSTAGGGTSLSRDRRQSLLGQFATRAPKDPLDDAFDKFLVARRRLVDLHLRSQRAAAGLTGTLDPERVFACRSGHPEWAAGLDDLLQAYWMEERAIQAEVAVCEESLLHAREDARSKIPHGANTATATPAQSLIALIDDALTSSDATEASVQEIRDRLRRSDAIALRWQTALASPPLLEFTLRPSGGSARYTIRIKRAAVVYPWFTKDEQAAAGADTSVVVAFTVTTHVQSRLALGVGLTELFEPRSRAYRFDPVTLADTVSYRVGTSDETHLTTRPMAIIGWYFHDVDDLEDGSRWMLWGGVEVASSPQTFAAGLARDWSSGWILGAGAHWYRWHEPARGWFVGQPVLTSQKSAAGSVPTVDQDGVGLVVFLGFRPQIFGAFWKLHSP